MRLRPILSLHLLLIFALVSSPAQTSHGYTLTKIADASSVDSTGAPLVGTPYTTDATLSGNTALFLAMPSNEAENRITDLTCSSTWALYSASAQGGPITPLVNSSTRLEAAQPAGAPTSVCSFPTAWGTEAVFAASYTTAQNTVRTGIYRMPLTGGNPTLIFPDGDAFPTPYGVRGFKFLQAMTDKILLVDVIIAENTFVRLKLTKTAGTIQIADSIPGLSEYCGGNGRTFSWPQISNMASDGTHFAGRGLWTRSPFPGLPSTLPGVILASPSEVMDYCLAVLFDPIASVPLLLPGVPQQPQGFTPSAANVHLVIAAINGSVYFTASQTLSDDSLYSGLFKVNIATRALTKVLSNRDVDLPDGLNPAPVTCQGQTQPFYVAIQAIGTPLDVGTKFAFSMTQRDCSPTPSKLRGGHYVYDTTSGILTLAVPDSAVPGAQGQLGNVLRAGPRAGIISATGSLLYNVFTKVTHTTADSYYPTEAALYGVNLNQKAVVADLTAPSSANYASQVAMTLALKLADNTAVAGATGKIHFYDGTTLLGDVVLDSNGTATYTTNSLSVGSHSLKAVYDGDAGFQGADSAVSTLTVGQGATTITMSSDTLRTPRGAAATLTARAVPSVGGTPTGSVVFRATGIGPLGTVALDGSARAALDLSTLAAGTYNITASYAGDTNFTASMGVATVYVTSTATLNAVLTPATPVYGDTVSAALTLTGASGTPTGTLTITLDQGIPVMLTLTNGMATFSRTGLSAGAHTAVVAYSGDNTYSPFSGPQTFTVAKAATSLALKASVTQVPVNTATVLTATLTAAGTPTGSVIFLNGTTTLGTGNLANGVATFNYTPTAAGALSLTAVYAGDVNDVGSTSAAVTGASGTPDFTITANPASATIKAGGSATFTFTVAPSFGFNQTISFGCSGLPANSKCTFTPATLTLNGSEVTSTLVFSTNVSSAAVLAPNLWNVTGGVVMAAVVLPLLGLRKYRKLGMMVVVACTALVGLSGCGGSSAMTPATPVTPAGSNTVQVNAGVAAGTGTSHNAAISITIQ